MIFKIGMRFTAKKSIYWIVNQIMGDKISMEKHFVRQDKIDEHLSTCLFKKKFVQEMLLKGKIQHEIINDGDKERPTD